VFTWRYISPTGSIICRIDAKACCIMRNWCRNLLDVETYLSAIRTSSLTGLSVRKNRIHSEARKKCSLVAQGLVEKTSWYWTKTNALLMKSMIQTSCSNPAIKPRTGKAWDSYPSNFYLRQYKPRETHLDPIFVKVLFPNAAFVSNDGNPYLFALRSVMPNCFFIFQRLSMLFILSRVLLSNKWNSYHFWATLVPFISPHGLLFF